VQLSPKRPVPVFPLPNFVPFPKAVVSLHVFELRYRLMMRAVLDAEPKDRLIAMALLRPGWERDYHESPAYHELGCLGRCTEVEWQPDDCYNLELVGLTRVRLGRLEQEYPYRVAQAVAVAEAPYSDEDPLVQSERKILEELWRRVKGSGALQGVAAPGVDGAETFEEAVNSLATILPMEPELRQSLLELDGALDRWPQVRAILAASVGAE
jgi:Lon protease-like protein